ncbi:FixH family protein [Geminicoccus harenae]|uniref:FixH family protein n=1 Tax=Geminicoccus harenae TaxID=2498453 RepID=UPI001C981FBD|nr:FixH family protein [Geminicoccus harenae]
MNAKAMPRHRAVRQASASPVDPRREARSRRIVLGSLAAFALVVLAMNGFLITMAVKTWRGLAVDSPYERGLSYNQTLEQVRAQTALGWQVEVAFRASAPSEGKLDVTLRDKAGQPISGAELEVVLVRPTQAGSDFRAYLNGVGSGVYQAELAFPAAGVWDAYLAARAGEDSYQRRERLLVR